MRDIINNLSLNVATQSVTSPVINVMPHVNKKWLMNYSGMKIIFILMILIVLVPIPARSADWQLVAENKENKIQIDKEGVNFTSKNMVKAWFRTVPNTPFKIFDKYMTHQIAYEEHNCAKRTFRVLEATGYHSDGTIKQVISKPSKWIDVPIGTIFETKHEYLCGNRKI
jgi:tyrosine-protein phosphatase YwqE